MIHNLYYHKYLPLCFGHPIFSRHYYFPKTGFQSTNPYHLTSRQREIRRLLLALCCCLFLFIDDDGSSRIIGYINRSSDEPCLRAWTRLFFSWSITRIRASFFLCCCFKFRVSQRVELLYLFYACINKCSERSMRVNFPIFEEIITN